MFTKAEIFDIALRQSAADMNCRAEDFLCGENVIVPSRADARARKYLSLPFDCDLVSYGGNVVASVRPDLEEIVRGYIGKYPAVHLFETPHLLVLDEALRAKGLRVCFMAEYFLPEPDLLPSPDCAYPIGFLEGDRLKDLYLPEWSNALCEKRKELDRIAAAATDGGKIVGLAGASADCEEMWQIGVNVLPDYRRRGIASALTAALAKEILNRGKVPFYCAAWSNLPSVRNAIACGFRPAWAELTAKSIAFTDDMNGL